MLIGMVGKMGSGKTLSMTVLGCALSDILGLSLYSNYEISSHDVVRIRSIDDLNAASHGIILLDEFWLSIDSRLSKDNVEMTRWLQMTRKKDLLVVYTSQHPSQVDIRVRRATDWLVFCEKTSAGIWLNFLDYQWGIIGKRLLIKDPARFFKMYDTYQVMASLQK